MYTSITKPSVLVSPLIDSVDVLIDGIDTVIDDYLVDSYNDYPKPEFKNYLLTQDGEFLLFQEGSLINISGSGYDDIEKTNQPIYTDV